MKFDSNTGPGVDPPRGVPAAPPVPRETFVGAAILPEGSSFSASPMAAGKPGLPRRFSCQGRGYAVAEVLEEWKEAGDCRHGSGERYVRKHWFRVRTTDGLELRLYFERQARSSGGSRWRLYSWRKTSGESVNQ